MRDGHLALCILLGYVGLVLVYIGFARMEQQGYGRAAAQARVVSADRSNQTDLHGSASSGAVESRTTMKRRALQGGVR